MTMDSRENSQNDGAPQRLFLFTMGDQVFAYVNSPKVHNHTQRHQRYLQSYSHGYAFREENPNHSFLFPFLTFEFSGWQKRSF